MICGVSGRPGRGILLAPGNEGEGDDSRKDWEAVIF